MATSILLLIALQFLWLRNSYDNARSDLAREANIVFRSTLLNMWDSVVAKSIRQLPVDSGVDAGSIVIGRRDSSVEITRVEDNVIRRTRDSAAVRIVFSTRDSILPKGVLKPLVSRMNENPAEGRSRTFILQLSSDTLDRRKVRQKLSDAFLRSGIDTEFLLHISRTPEMLPEMPDFPRGLLLRKRKTETPAPGMDRAGIITEPVSLNPMQGYSVELVSVEGYLSRRISPEIFFSVVLTAIIGSAFAFMYRNIRAQQRLVESKNEFINNVTHELKTPVSTVSVALEAIQNFRASSNEDLAKEYLQIARRELARLNDITDRILKTSILEHEILNQKEHCDLSALIQNVLNDKKIIIEQREVTVAYSVAGSDFSLYCDPYHLYQLVENLLDNAIKYSPEHPHVDITLKGSEHSVELIVADRGIGIPKEYHDKIFEKFFRVPTGDVHTIKGYGLGLSYVQNLVRSLGGKIVVNSEPGAGTSFNISFPRMSKKL